MGRVQMLRPAIICDKRDSLNKAARSRAPAEPCFFCSFYFFFLLLDCPKQQFVLGVAQQMGSGRAAMRGGEKN